MKEVLNNLRNEHNILLTKNLKKNELLSNERYLVTKDDYLITFFDLPDVDNPIIKPADSPNASICRWKIDSYSKSFAHAVIIAVSDVRAIALYGFLFLLLYKMG